MFDIGFAELILLAGLGLIVLGPKRLPRVAAQMGRWVGQARRMSRTLMYQLRQEVNLDDSGPFAARKSPPPEGAQAAGKTARTGDGAAANGGGKEAPGKGADQPAADAPGKNQAASSE